jgi:hypothetical protein
MYLNYDEYKKFGGRLEHSAFNVFEKKAEYFLNSQAVGQTGERLKRLVDSQNGVVPECVKDCIFLLMEFYESNKSISGIASESQSLGGQSESVSYIVHTENEVNAQCENIIKSCLYGGNLGYLLYRGASEC